MDWEVCRGRWWEEGSLEGSHPSIRRGYEARIPMAMLVETLMGGMEGLRPRHGRMTKVKAFRPPNRPHKSSKFEILFANKYR